MLPVVEIRWWDRSASVFSTEVAMCRSVEADVDACVDWRIVVSAYSSRQQLDRVVLLNMEMDQGEAESRRLYPALLAIPRDAWKAGLCFYGLAAVTESHLKHGVSRSPAL